MRTPCSQPHFPNARSGMTSKTRRRRAGAAPWPAVRTTAWLLLAAGVAAALAACGPTYSMKIPPSFKRYERSGTYRLITADGVMLQAREVDNYPKADLSFWTDALQRHEAQRGYTLQQKECFTTAERLDGCTLDFLVPHGAEDWVLSSTLFVVGDRVVVVETAGPFPRYAKVRDELAAALKTFDPGDD